MKILLDECIDRRLGRELAPHEVTTVPRRGWAGIKNGQLLALAEKGFDIFLTVDQHIPNEQNLQKFQIAVVFDPGAQQSPGRDSPARASSARNLAERHSGKTGCGRWMLR